MPQAVKSKAKKTSVRPLRRDGVSRKGVAAPAVKALAVLRKRMTSGKAGVTAARTELLNDPEYIDEKRRFTSALARLQAHGVKVIG